MNIIDAYLNGTIKGWAGPELAAEQFNLIKSRYNFVDYKAVGPKGEIPEKTMLYNFARQVLGKDIPNYAQTIGSCVAHGAKNASEILECVQIALEKKPFEWHPICTAYYYGASRVLIGGGQLGREDGSLGSWMAAAVMKYGALRSDEEGVPPWSGELEREWGYRGPPQKFIKFGQEHLVRAAAQMKSWTDVCRELSNGRPCTIASEQGFTMQADNTGFHQATREPCPHQMCFIGHGTKPEPYGVIMNSWGEEAHGLLKDFDDGTPLPLGVIRLKQRVCENMISSGECFSYADMDGYVDRSAKIAEALFKIVGLR